MKKSDLKDGMVIEQRDGKRFLLLGEHAYNKNGWVNINDYTKDFNTWEGFYEHGIVTIYRLKGIASSFKDLLDDENLEVIWKRKEPVKLTRFQHEALNRIASEYEYLARDKGEGIWAYSVKPYKGETGWLIDDGYYERITPTLDVFDFVKWEDSEPTNIQKILNNCEVAN